MRNYCTVFDKYYLYQGCALYNSLTKVTTDFILYALCLDELSYETILKLNNSNFVPIVLSEIMSEEVIKLRARTTYPQFCWACQPLVCELVLDKFKAEMVTYLEADSLFFSDPEVLFNEMGEKSVTLAPHNFPADQDQSKTAGTYITHFNAFRNDECGRNILNEWKRNCFLYDKDNPPSFRPGQLLMDEWPDKFDCVHVLQNIGAGVAPWNVESESLKLVNDKLYFNEIAVVFYHFHKYARTVDGRHDLGDYKISTNTIALVYQEYARSIDLAKQQVAKMNNTFDYIRLVDSPITLRRLLSSFSVNNLLKYLRLMKLIWMGRYNVITNEKMYAE
jgi:hypothetical protein